MEEFTISFRYNHKDQKAGVIKSDKPKEVEFNVRPIAPEIVRKFGNQISIFRKEGNYNIQRHVVLKDKEFYAALISAIQQTEKGGLNGTIKILMKKRRPAAARLSPSGGHS